jgi:hypothetical protein
MPSYKLAGQSDYFFSTFRGSVVEGLHVDSYLKPKIKFPINPNPQMSISVVELLNWEESQLLFIKKMEELRKN